MSTRECRICGIEKPLEEFRLANVREARTPWRRTECKLCENNLRKGRAIARRNAPPPPPLGTPCPQCGVTDRQLVLDHCHETNKFRDYICQRCNHGFGAFPTIKSLEKAKQYLRNHQ